MGGNVGERGLKSRLYNVHAGEEGGNMGSKGKGGEDIF